MDEIATYECGTCGKYTAVQAHCDPGLCPDCGADELAPRAVASPMLVVRELLAGNAGYVVASLRGKNTATASEIG